MMIRDYLDIDGKWGVLAYYNARPRDFRRLAPILREFFCPEPEIRRANETIIEPNKAFIYNAPWEAMSVLVIGHVTNPAQFLNSLLHEFDHLQDVILQCYNVPHGTEDAAYLQGYLGEIAYERIIPFLCPACHRP